MWYFNLVSKGEMPLWVNYDSLSSELKLLLDYDDHYSCHEVSLRDLAYQAVEKGLNLDCTAQHLNMIIEPTVLDNYIFIRKYFNSNWAFLILIIRLFSFVNVIHEIKSFKKSKGISRTAIAYDHSDLKNFSSPLINSKPFISIVIPTLNRYVYLKDVLLDLEKQTYPYFEVLICDQSDLIDQNFYKEFDLDLKLICQKEKALWLARNRCIKESRGEYLLLFDDDSRVEPDWIENHLLCVDYYNVEISSGVSLSEVGGRIPENYSIYRMADQLDTGNALIHKDVFRKVGLFDRQFERQRMGDGEFGLRCYLSGVKNISNPDAKRIHLKAGVGGLRQMGGWDAFRPKSIFSPRPIPSVLYYARKYYGPENVVFLFITKLPPSLVPYALKHNSLLSYLSFLFCIFIMPLVSFQVLSSWRISSKMLAKGSKIEDL